MLHLVSWAVYLLVTTFSGVAARAVDANIVSLPTLSSMLSETSNTTASSHSCTDIKSCRTLDQIVVSCLGTILACIWFAVHRNIPAPKRNPSYHSNLFLKSAQWAWATVLDQRESGIVFFVALLAPEWILAWALRQAIVAWQLARTLEKARLRAQEEQKGRCSETPDLENIAGKITTSADSHSSRLLGSLQFLDGYPHKPRTLIDGSAAAHAEPITSRLIKRRYNVSAIYSACDKCEGRWEWSHGFFVAMGGFYFYDEDGPLYPLSPADVVELVERGHLVPPTAEEISDKSKGDALSKGVAVSQTLWFVVQCIARRAENLPVTNLEVMTLAYTVMTVAMYGAWWAKPLNVSCVVRVPEEQVEEERVLMYNSIWEKVFMYVMGGQDRYVDLRQCTHVPTWWSGNADQHDTLIADAIALLVAMVFGAVHCIAWYSVFQSGFEQQLWRSSAITIIAVPVALFVVFFGAIVVDDMLNWNAFAITSGTIYTPIAVIYIVARLTLIILSSTSLRSLPFEAYQTIQWTTFMPHI